VLRDHLGEAGGACDYAVRRIGERAVGPAARGAREVIVAVVGNHRDLRLLEARDELEGEGGFALAAKRGSEAHDEIHRDERGFYRETNHAGGIEAGISNGEPIVVRAGMKPLPTLMRPLDSVDLETGEPAKALVERSDVQAVEALARVAARATALELDLASGRRGDRDSIVEDDLVALTGAEAATVVNNNAAAVLLALNTFAEGREVVVSRGELIEIGGSFRIPELMAKSGAKLCEVGTTNRTHPQDYADAIGARTAALLKVHTSNYRVVGFTAEVSLQQLVAIGRERGGCAPICACTATSRGTGTKRKSSPDGTIRI